MTDIFLNFYYLIQFRVQLLSLPIRQGNWGKDKLTNLLKITELENIGTQNLIQVVSDSVLGYFQIEEMIFKS